MAKRLKVYGGMAMRKYGQRRAIIAAYNAQEVANALGNNASAYYIRGYWSETGNIKEIEAAKAKPGILLIERERNSFQYEPDAL